MLSTRRDELGEGQEKGLEARPGHCRELPRDERWMEGSIVR